MDNTIAKNNAKKSAAISVACVWFGTHVGGGFATGNQTVMYFASFGWPTIFMPVLIIMLLGWCYYNSAVMAKNHQVFRYDQFAEELYAPFSKAGKMFFDVAYIVLVVVGSGIAIAGGGELLRELFGLNYYLGIILTGFIFFILTSFGAKLVRSASTVITLLILVSLLIILVPGLRNAAPNVSQIVATKDMFGASWGKAIWMALLYSGFQSLVAASIISTSDTLKTTKDCKKFAIMGTIINGVMLGLCAVMLLGHMPAVKETSLPIFDIVSKFNQPILLVAYSVSLYCAFISTGVGVTFGLVARFEEKIFTGLDINKRRMIISFLAILGAILLSIGGLTKLVAVGYGWLGRICIPLLVFPLAVIAPIKNSKFKKEHPEVL